MHENTKIVRKQAASILGTNACVTDAGSLRRIHQHSFWYSPHRLNDKVSRLLPFPVTEPPLLGFFVFLAVSRASANMGADAFPSA